MAWIKLDDDQYFNSDKVAVVRPVSKTQCAIFLSHSDPVAGGFLVDADIDSVLEALREARIVELASMLSDETDKLAADHTAADTPA